LREREREGGRERKGEKEKELSVNGKNAEFDCIHVN